VQHLARPRLPPAEVDRRRRQLPGEPRPDRQAGPVRRQPRPRRPAAADGGGARNDQFFPWVDSNPAGNLYAIWFDRRRDPANHDIDTWQAVSTNDGRSWRTFRISTRSWDPDKGFFASGAFIGDYNGIAASNRVVYPVWTDGRNSNFDQNGIGETDIFTNVELLQ
jgi:hypothetical protein